jgi:hypothetical protein
MSTFCSTRSIPITHDARTGSGTVPTPVLVSVEQSRPKLDKPSNWTNHKVTKDLSALPGALWELDQVVVLKVRLVKSWS